MPAATTVTCDVSAARLALSRVKLIEIFGSILYHGGDRELAEADLEVLCRRALALYFTSPSAAHVAELVAEFSG